MKIATAAVAVPDQQTSAFSNMLTAQMVANEFAMLVYRLGARAYNGSSTFPLSKAHQSNVDFPFKINDRMLKLDDFSSHILKPLAVRMMRVINSSPILPAPPLSRGCHESVVANHRGVGVRFMTDYSVGRDMIISRFDIMHT